MGRIDADSCSAHPSEPKQLGMRLSTSDEALESGHIHLCNR